jgi:hypothetical protein
MKWALLVCSFIAFALSGCGGWTVEPLPYVSPSPLPSSTPVIFSPTPVILVPPTTATLYTPTLTLAPTTPISASATNPVTSTSTPSFTGTPTAGSSTPAVGVTTKILGCTNGLDITHGMGAVTNAYVTISNPGSLPLNTVCATLNALGEGRPHPDKTKCVAVLPAGDQVTEKLTVDTTFQKTSPIQVEIDSQGSFLQRVGQSPCVDLGLLPPDLDGLGVVAPVPPSP